jgi:acetyl esterase
MPLHPELQAMLDNAAGQPPMHTLPISEVRELVVARNAILTRPKVAAVEDRAIPGPSGRALPVRIYRPDIEGRRPVVAFFHGGGFTTGGIESHDGFARHLCCGSAAIVVSVDYSLAPEHKFPAATDECLASVRWVAEHAASFGGDARRIAVAGDSSGGNMAAVTALRLRDEGGPAVRALVLLYPVTDHYSAGMAAYAERGSGCGLTSDDMRWFWDLYLNDAGEGSNPLASPNRHPDLRGLPPTYVVTAEYDPLRDDGGTFAERLGAAGVAVTHVRYADANHGFMKWAGMLDRADEALADACAWLKRAFRE